MDKRANKLKQLRRDEEAVKKIKNEGTKEAINILQIIPAYVLATKFDFGNIRLSRFLYQYNRYVKLILQDSTDLDKMTKEMEHDKGIRFDGLTGDIINLWQDENDPRRVIRGERKKK